jgi:hypothetical protein
MGAGKQRGYSDIMTIDLKNPESVDAAKTKMTSFQDRINRVECKDKYPLKHETLEYTVIHMIDFLNYILDEDYTKAQQAMNRVELNVNQFQDWSVDMP